MSSLPEVSIPSFQNSKPIDLHGDNGIIIIRTTLTEKSSVVMKIARYVVLLASHILPVLTSAQRIEITSAQRSLNGVGAIETLFDGNTTVNGLSKEINTLQKDFSKWKKATITSGELAASLGTQGLAVIDKFDSLLWAGENFGLGENNLSIGLHAVAYSGTIFLMLKNYIELAQSIESAKNDPEKARSLNVKYAKFLFATGAAAMGFITLFVKSSVFAVLWIIFAAATSVLSLADFAIESSIDPEKKEREAIKKAYQPLTIDMAL